MKAVPKMDKSESGQIFASLFNHLVVQRARIKSWINPDVRKLIHSAPSLPAYASLRVYSTSPVYKGPGLHLKSYSLSPSPDVKKSKKSIFTQPPRNFASLFNRPSVVQGARITSRLIQTGPGLHLDTLRYCGYFKVI